MSKKIDEKAMERLKALAKDKDFNIGDSQVSAWTNGYFFGVSDIFTKLWVAKQRMLDAYMQGLQEGSDEEACHASLAVLAMEVEMIIHELKPEEEMTEK